MTITFYRVSYNYLTTIGNLSCAMSNSCVVAGSDNAMAVKQWLDERGIRQTHIEPFTAPPMVETMRRLATHLQEFPLRAEKPAA